MINYGIMLLKLLFIVKAISSLYDCDNLPPKWPETLRNEGQKKFL